jgi:hypothetical protein
MDINKIKKEVFVTSSDNQTRGPDRQYGHSVQRLSQAAIKNRGQYEFIVAWQQEKKEEKPRQLNLAF